MRAGKFLSHQLVFYLYSLQYARGNVLLKSIKQDLGKILYNNYPNIDFKFFYVLLKSIKQDLGKILYNNYPHIYFKFLFFKSKVSVKLNDNIPVLLSLSGTLFLEVLSSVQGRLSSFPQLALPTGVFDNRFASYKNCKFDN